MGKEANWLKVKGEGVMAKLCASAVFMMSCSSNPGGLSGGTWTCQPLWLSFNYLEGQTHRMIGNLFSEC